MTWDDEPCDARHDDVTSIVCERPEGHAGEHRAAGVSWDTDDEEMPR